VKLLTPFSSSNAMLRSVICAMIGGYGLPFITISVLLLLAYVLYQLRLI